MNVPAGLLDKLVAEINAVDVLRDDDVTIPRLVEQTGRSRSFVERYMAEQVKAGKLIAVPSHDPQTGRPVTAYRAG
jgi:response regulator of citrate/malate metabolism